MENYSKYHMFSMIDRVEKESTELLRRTYKNALVLKKEEAVSESRGVYLLATSVKILRDPKHTTCPVKTLALFVHNRDITVNDNEMLKLFDDCKEAEDILRLSK